MDDLEERCFQLKRRIEFLKKRIAVAGGVQETSDNARPVQWVETEAVRKEKTEDSTSRRISHDKSFGDRSQGTTTQKSSGRRKSSDNSTSDEDKELARALAIALGESSK